MRLLCLFLLSFSPIYASAQPLFDWSSNNIQLLHGNHFNSTDNTRTITTIQHADGWKYGENFFFIDIDNRAEADHYAIYGEFYPRLSWSKITGKTPSFSLFKDFSLVAGLNAGNQPERDPFRAYLLGAGIKFNMPGFDFFVIDVMAFKSENVNTTGVQISPAWNSRFPIGSLNFEFKGFLDWQSADVTGGVSNVLAQPQLLLDVGDIFGYSKTFYAGIEYQYWHNKFGVKHLNENFPQAMILLNY